MTDFLSHIDYQNWIETYKPIDNHFDKNAGIDGRLFLPFGEQWLFVKHFDKENIWSLIITDLDDSDETFWEITSGIHFVNNHGYLVTKSANYKDLSISY